MSVTPASGGNDDLLLPILLGDLTLAGDVGNQGMMYPPVTYGGIISDENEVGRSWIRIVVHSRLTFPHQITLLTSTRRSPRQFELSRRSVAGILDPATRRMRSEPVAYCPGPIKQRRLGIGTDKNISD